MPGYYDENWQALQNQNLDQGPTIPGAVDGLTPSQQAGYNDMFGGKNNPTTSLGGTNNPTSGPGIEDWQDQRLAQMGAAAPIQGMPQWQQQQQGQYQQWANQSQGMQQDQYNQALAQYNGGTTAGQQALTQQQGAQMGALGSAAHSATGGARGAAAAAGNAVQAGGQAMGMQANQMAQQKLADKYAGAQMMQSIADQQRGLQQGEWQQHANANANKAGYQQGWNALNDQGALWANTMKANRQMGDLGYQTGAANQNAANSQFYQGLTGQYISAGANAVSGVMSAVPRGGGSDGGWQGSYDGTIYQKSPY